MEIDVKSVILSTRVYAALRERFFIGHAAADTVEADGGEVLATIRDMIVHYVQEQMGVVETREADSGMLLYGSGC